MAWIFDTYSMNVGPLGARRRDGQAALARRLARPRAGDRARRALLHPHRPAEGRHAGSRTRASRSRASATWAATSPRLARRGGRAGRRALGLVRRRHEPRTASTSRRRSRTRPTTGALAGLPGAEAITNDELIELECDVLVPCALEQVINGDNAPRVRARMVCEGANGPTTPAADAILEDRGILVLPDVLANAGGVVVSYFEWVQGLQEYFWKEYEVNAKLNDIVVRAFEETWSTRERFGDEHARRRLRARRAAGRRGDDDPRPLPVAWRDRPGRRTVTPRPARRRLRRRRGCHLCEAAHRGRAAGLRLRPIAVRRRSTAIPQLERALPRADPGRRGRRRRGVHVLRRTPDALRASSRRRSTRRERDGSRSHALGRVVRHDCGRCRRTRRPPEGIRWRSV